MIGFVQSAKTIIFHGEKGAINVQPQETVILGLKEIRNGEIEIDPKDQEEVETIADLKDQEEKIVNLTIIKNLIPKKQSLGHQKDFVENLEPISKIEN